jgi:hypothetical protein
MWDRDYCLHIGLQVLRCWNIVLNVGRISKLRGGSPSGCRQPSGDATLFCRLVNQDDAVRKANAFRMYQHCR